ncbi:MAG TPA: hypothetical protein VGM11_02310, partial [Acidobacteriaceae bacterium]
MNRRACLLSCLLASAPLCATLSGCHAHALSGNAEQARAERNAEQNTARQQLELIPPPSKNRFMAIHTAESWENPSITVEPGMLELRITLADPNPS